MEIVVYIQATNREYNLNDPADLLWMREDLTKIGFFSYPENKQYWGMFTRVAKKEEVEDLMNSIKLYEIKSKRCVPRRAD